MHLNFKIWDRAYVYILSVLQRLCLRFLVGRPFVKRSPYVIGPLSVCPVCPRLSVCDVGVLWPNGLTDQDETWHAGRPRPGHIVLDGDPAPPPPKGHSPQFSAHIRCSQMVTSAKEICNRRCLFACLSVSVSNFAQKLPNGFERNFQRRLAMGQ